MSIVVNIVFNLCKYPLYEVIIVVFITNHVQFVLY